MLLAPPASPPETLRVTMWAGLREALRAGRALPAAHFDRNATTPVTDLVALGGRELSSVRRDHVCACGFGFWYR
jgi:hypothetical protein